MVKIKPVKNLPFAQKLSQALVLLTGSLLGILAIVNLQIPRLNKLIVRNETVSTETLQKEVESEKLRLNVLKKIPAFGFDNLIADSVLLSFQQYFGDDVARQLTGYELSPEYFEIIVNRDPRFLAAYIPLSSSMSLYAGKPEQGIALMNQGLKSMSANIPPRSYYVWRYKGIDELLFLGDAKLAQHSFEMAAQWASVHPDSESKNVAFISRRTAQFLAGNPNISCAQESAWAQLLANAINANDDRTRNQAIARIEERGGKVTILPEGAVSVQMPKCSLKQQS